jgi:carboxyl-terminal processing protease
VGFADLFLDGGAVVTTHGREGENRYMARAGDIAAALPMLVLINKKTAEGAEIVAGALQDNGRAQLVGEASAGVTAIETVIPIRGGRDGVLKLTTSRALLPSGRSFEGIALKPDIVVSAQRLDADAALEVALATLRKP